MEKIHFETFINAPKEKVWKTMLEDVTYRQWTEVFNPEGGSYYEGKWEQGSEINFFGPDKDGNVGGMYSKIKEARPYDFVSIQHLGEVSKGEKKLWPAEPASYENYTFIEKKLSSAQEDVTTLLRIDLNIPSEHKEMFQEMWPKALEKLKELAEK